MVTPLPDGPSLVLACVAEPGALDSMAGLTLDDHRRGYTVATTEGNVVPIAVGRAGDGDDYERRYLHTDADPLRVGMKAGLLIDPRSDSNPATSVDVAGVGKPLKVAIHCWAVDGPAIPQVVTNEGGEVDFNLPSPRPGDFH